MYWLLTLACTLTSVYSSFSEYGLSPTEKNGECVHRDTYAEAYWIKCGFLQTQECLVYRMSIREGSIRCQCCEGWDGKCGECRPQCQPHCENGGLCVAPHTCQCKLGYWGRRCETGCGPIGCKNGGTCIEGVHCICPPYFAGHRCEYQLKGGECQREVTEIVQKQEQCGWFFLQKTCTVYYNRVIGTECRCCEGYEGKCEDRCVPLVPCNPPCLNGGTCFQGNCRCRGDFWGDHCQFMLKKPMECKGVLRKKEMISVQCGWFFVVNRCQQERIVELPDQCICCPEFEGDCGQCSPRLCREPCQNGGACTARDTCTCLAFYTGRLCEIRVCEPPCMNGGECLAENRCRCPHQLVGPRCEHQLKEPFECAQEEVIKESEDFECGLLMFSQRCKRYRVVHTGVRECVCCPTYEGTCQDRCVPKVVSCSQECEHGGVCKGINVCHCAPGWSGAWCQQPVCLLPCQNGGVCVGPNKCVCTNSYYGEQCEKLAQPVTCFPPCQNGGYCIYQNVCVCRMFYTGTRCEQIAG